MKGVQNENTSDVGGGKSVGYIDTGDWMSYPEVTIPSTGLYRVEYRVASQSGGGSLQLEKAGGSPVYGRLSIPATGGWQTWVTVSHTVNLNAGPNVFGILATGGGWNFNWFRITKAAQ
jgi:endoglucanase